MCTLLFEFVFRVYKCTKLILILFEFVFRVYKCTRVYNIDFNFVFVFGEIRADSGGRFAVPRFSTRLRRDQ
jgi:hypothetical protein